MDPTQAKASTARALEELRPLLEHFDTVGRSSVSRAAVLAAGRELGFRDEFLGDANRASPRKRVAEGLELLGALGLASAALVDFSIDPQGAECRVICRFQCEPNEGAEARSRDLLAAGYLAGWVSSLTGIEVVCRTLGREPEGGALICELEQAPVALDGSVNVRSSRAPSNGDLRGLGIELEDLVEMTLDAIVFLDSEGTIRYWNRGAALMFGYEREEVLGRHFRFLVPRELFQGGELERLRAACARDGVVFNHETRRLRKDGETIWVSLTRTVSSDRSGHEVGVVATMRDITEQRQREQELERSRSLALVGELAAKIAHEVKNPLTGIYAALQVLEGQLDPSDPRREVFGSIGDEVIRLNDLTQELLSFSRPAEPQLRRDDLREFLVDLTEDLERLSMVGSDELSLDGLERGLEVRFDRNLTGPAFKNLILNGLQANGGSGTVRLSSRRHRQAISIDVADSGPGIPKEQRASIFEPFFTTKSRGTGLGLSIARKNLEAQGASIRLRSHSGRGAIFRVEFPLS